MHHRRLLIVPLLALILSSGHVLAASWHVYSSKPLGFAVHYPATWKVLAVAQPGMKQIQFTYQGKSTYTVDVTILNLDGGKSRTTLKQRFLAFERRSGNPSIATMHWGAITLGHRPGIGAVYIPTTEGGVSVANGMYVIPWKAHTYVVNVQSVQKPAPKTLARFPAIYKQMLATWRFI